MGAPKGNTNASKGGGKTSLYQIRADDSVHELVKSLSPIERGKIFEDYINTNRLTTAAECG